MKNEIYSLALQNLALGLKNLGESGQNIEQLSQSLDDFSIVSSILLDQQNGGGVYSTEEIDYFNQTIKEHYTKKQEAPSLLKTIARGFRF